MARKLRFREAAQVSVLSQHRREGSYGLAGGQAGVLSQQWMKRRDGRQEALDGIDQSRLEPGHALVIETSGGGGWGT